MKNTVHLFLLLIAFMVVRPSSAMAQGALSAVQFIDANNVAACGPNGAILRSPDAGSSWSNQSSGYSSYLLGLSFSSANVGVVVGGDPISGTQAILRTANGGSSWGPEPTVNAQPLVGASFVDANNGFAVGYSGTVLYTSNGGSSWVSRSANTLANFHGVFFTDANSGTVVGDFGLILRTSNAGVSWTVQSSGTGNTLYAVHFQSPSTGTVVGAGGFILRTTDGGTIWTRQTAGTSNNLNAVNFVNSNTGWAVGNNGTILHTANGGASWSPQSAAIVHYYGVSFKDGNTGVAVGSNTILRTTNGGASWAQQSVGGGSGGGGTPDVTPPAISGISSSSISSSGSLITWGTNESSSSIIEYGLTTIYGSATSNLSSVTSHSITLSGLSPATTYHYRVKSADASGNTATSGDHSFVTGSSFSYSPISGSVLKGGLISGSYSSLAISDANYYVLGSTTKGTRMTDWYASAVVSPVSSTIVSMKISYTGNFSRTTTQVLYLYNWASASWVQIDSRPVGATDVTETITQASPVNFVSSSGEIRLRVVGTGGSKSFNCSANYLQIVVETSGTSLFTQVPVDHEEATAVPSSYQLLQNYPNPFNPTTSIQFNLPEASEVNVAVYDLVGQEVARLVQEVMDAGSHSVTWNARGASGLDLPSGIYLYRIRATSLSGGKNFEMVKKMNLVK